MFCPELAALPMWQTASVGGMRIGIVHGDAQSLMTDPDCRFLADFLAATA